MGWHLVPRRHHPALKGPTVKLEHPDPFQRIAEMLKHDDAFTVSFDLIDGTEILEASVVMFWGGDWIVVQVDGFGPQHIRVSSIIRAIID